MPDIIVLNLPEVQVVDVVQVAEVLQEFVEADAHTTLVAEIDSIVLEAEVET